MIIHIFILHVMKACTRAFAAVCPCSCVCYSMLQGNCFAFLLIHTMACTCSQATVTLTVTVLSVILSLVLTLSLSTCTVSAVVHAVMYKRLQRCRAELRGGELCSTPQLSQSLLWSRAAASLHAGGGDSVKAGPEGEGPPTMEVEGEKMQANPAYLPIEMMSYKSQESKYINVSSWSNGRNVYTLHTQ